jgi:cephalosporin-C deacetylase-like acetyl esterase
MFRGEMLTHSNFSGIGATAVGNNAGTAPFGAQDAAGNVREWTWNATSDRAGGERYILGGSWSDPSYLFTYGIAESPWDRSENNGFRLARYTDELGAVSALQQPVELPRQEKISPISDEIFQVYRDLYGYDRAALNVIVESVDTQSAHWSHETVSFDAPYGDERVIAHVFLPKNIEPPYQVVAYYPSSSAIYTSTSDDLELPKIDFIIKSGRALVIPVLRGTYERNIGLDTTWPKNTRAYSDNVIKWIQEFRRTIDYLESRDDMDLDRLAYYGFSWGGWNGPIVLALDDRFETGVFVSGGIPPTLARPEASSASFAARVKAPVLMISGRHDVLRPVATYQTPMFESIGTPDDLKHHAILEGGHAPPQSQLSRETLDWLDQYLGPVQ